MTRERKVYAAVLVAAVSALGADLLFFQSGNARPQSADNLLINPGPRVVAHKTAAGATPTAVAKGSATVGLAALAARMSHVLRVEHLDLENAKDVFRPSAVWIIHPQQLQVMNEPSPITVFVSAHRVVALLKSTHGDHGGMAVVQGKDRRSIRVGQELDGFKLVGVTEKSATFEFKGQTVQLDVQPEGEGESHGAVSSGR